MGRRCAVEDDFLATLSVDELEDYYRSKYQASQIEPIPEKPASGGALWIATSVTAIYEEAKNAPGLEYLVPLVMPKGPFLHLWTGLPGAGKSLAVTSLLFSLASGLPCWGKHSVSRCPSIYIDLEAGRKINHVRVRWLINGFEQPPERFSWCRVLDGLRRINVEDREVLSEIENSIHRIEDELGEKVPLVAFDSLSYLQDRDENTAEMTKPMAALRDFAEKLDVGIHLTHHSAKTTQVRRSAVEMARGHTSIVANVDTHLSFSKTTNGLVRVEMGKNRLGREIDPFHLRLEGSEEEDFARVTWVEEGPGSLGAGERAREFTLSYLEDAGARVSKAELAEMAQKGGIALRTLEAELKKLVEEKVIERHKKGKESSYGLPRA